MALLGKLTALAGTAEVARRYAKRNPEKVNRFAGQAAQFVDKKTKGKYHDQLDGAVRKVRQVTGEAPA
jgi:hypothetical protein